MSQQECKISRRSQSDRLSMIISPPSEKKIKESNKKKDPHAFDLKQASIFIERFRPKVSKQQYKGPVDQCLSINDENFDFDLNDLSVDEHKSDSLAPYVNRHLSDSIIQNCSRFAPVSDQKRKEAILKRNKIFQEELN